jgi:hypothetical protein
MFCRCQANNRSPGPSILILEYTTNNINNIGQVMNCSDMTLNEAKKR